MCNQQDVLSPACSIINNRKLYRVYYKKRGAVVVSLELGLLEDAHLWGMSSTYDIYTHTHTDIQTQTHSQVWMYTSI